MLSLNELKNILRRKGAVEFLYKRLSDNDNSKQQIYLGGSYEALQELPYGSIIAEQGTKRPTFKASINLSWLSDDGIIAPAPNAKLILYPKYPEVRLSGFLSGAVNAPREYLQPKSKEERGGSYDGRILILCVIDQQIIAYLAAPRSPISAELQNKTNWSDKGIFCKELLEEDSRSTLLQMLRSAYLSNPNVLQRLFPDGTIRSYESRNAAGYTLESKFGIIPNGNAEPDFKGWELKCSKDTVVTLMTPQPDGGIYHQLGNKEFVLRYGHPTSDGSMYFTGPYRYTSNLKFGVDRRLVITGYDPDIHKITDATGGIILLENDENIASWSFSRILTHWSNKHNKACYVRYKKAGINEEGRKQIWFLPDVFLCEGTSPIFLLDAVVNNLVFLDPGSKVSSTGFSKARNQFRVRLEELQHLYNTTEAVDLEKI